MKDPSNVWKKRVICNDTLVSLLLVLRVDLEYLTFPSFWLRFQDSLI